MVYERLKPAGIYVIIDHAAAAGTGTSDTQSLHRIDPASVRAEVQATHSDEHPYTGRDQEARPAALSDIGTSMLYELTTLSCPLLAVPAAVTSARAWIETPEAKGRVLGYWRTEIGTLGRVLVLRGFETAEGLAAERRRALLDANPFNAGDVVTGLSMESYAPFSFLPLVQPRAIGSVYEFRTYRLKPGGLPPTLAGWEQAIEPAREYTAHLVVNMYALDGSPRITHIWGFNDLVERATLRARAYGAGVWPPKGGPDQIIEATSTIALPEPDSPLH